MSALLGYFRQEIGLRALAARIQNSGATIVDRLWNIRVFEGDGRREVGVAGVHLPDGVGKVGCDTALDDKASGARREDGTNEFRGLMDGQKDDLRPVNGGAKTGHVAAQKCTG